MNIERIRAIMDKFEDTLSEIDNPNVKQFLEEMSREIRPAIELKTVNDLCKQGPYYVADYQRGYKWKESHVKALLDDIAEFSGKTAVDDDFYCLQPVVVKKKDEKWELIDGQQRVTTIYLILVYFGEILPHFPCFRIDYQTRPGSSDFLEQIKDNGEREWDELKKADISSNIDNFHFHAAYKVIQKYFEEYDIKKEIQFKNSLLKNTKVIWYEAKPENDAVTIFRNLNSGKIPLTNAELIKAMFLNKRRDNTNKDVSDLRQYELASEWDRMEATLQDDSFWYFINSDAQKDDRSTRIEFVLDLIAKKSTKRDDDFFTYHEFNKKLKEPEDTWDDVRKLFMRFCEWFEDNHLYHLIGFIITREFKNIRDIIDSAMNKTKKQFKDDIEEIIRNKLEKEEYQFDNMSYESSKQQLTDVLLLFNIETLAKINDYTLRFPFHLFLMNNWSLEHIHAQKSLELQGEDRWKALEKETETNEQLKKLLEKQDGCPSNEDQWCELQEKINRVVGDGMNIHSIENMALLTKDTNSSLNNAWFMTKRKRLKELEKNGFYVPICTQRAFSKYYTENVDNMLKWNETDGKEYRKAIESTIEEIYLRESN